MVEFFVLVASLIVLIVFCVLSFERSMWLCIDYWSNKQYRLWKVICATIGCVFLLTIVLICIFSSNRFSEKILKIDSILVISAFISMSIFSQILHLIAWINKRNVLRDNIRKIINAKMKNNCTIEETELLNICLAENNEYFTKRQIKKVFSKVVDEYFNNMN